MLLIIDTFQRSEIGDCWNLQIPISGCESEIRAMIGSAMRVERGVEAMLDGSMDFEDLLEFVEADVPSIDLYIEEVEENLSILLEER